MDQLLSPPDGVTITWHLLGKYRGKTTSMIDAFIKDCDDIELIINIRADLPEYYRSVRQFLLDSSNNVDAHEDRQTISDVLKPEHKADLEDWNKSNDRRKDEVIGHLRTIGQIVNRNYSMSDYDAMIEELKLPIYRTPPKEWYEERVNYTAQLRVKMRHSEKFCHQLRTAGVLRKYISTRYVEKYGLDK